MCTVSKGTERCTRKKVREQTKQGALSTDVEKYWTRKTQVKKGTSEKSVRTEKHR